MAPFAVYRHKGGGYVVDVQAGVLSGLQTRVVVPLLPARDGLEPALGLNPVFAFEGGAYVLATQFLGVVAVEELDGPLESLDRRGEEIGRALRMVLGGY